jgi:hypothetical protein
VKVAGLNFAVIPIEIRNAPKLNVVIFSLGEAENVSIALAMVIFPNVE